MTFTPFSFSEKSRSRLTSVPGCILALCVMCARRSDSPMQCAIVDLLPTGPEYRAEILYRFLAHYCCRCITVSSSVAKQAEQGSPSPASTEGNTSVHVTEWFSRGYSSSHYSGGKSSVAPHSAAHKCIQWKPNVGASSHAQCTHNSLKLFPSIFSNILFTVKYTNG